MSAVPYLFYRYSLVRGTKALTATDLWNILCDNTNIEVAYRKRYPADKDKDTSWIMPEEYELIFNGDAYTIISCFIARHIMLRSCNGYDKENDTIFKKEESTDEYAVCRTIFIPRIGIVAFADLSGEAYIGANSAVSRFDTIIRKITDVDCSLQLASTYADIKDALKKWTLTDFSYTARPFNPSIKKPGDLLHPLLAADNAAISGSARPNKEGALLVSDTGFINEVTGMAEHGYAEYGAKGTTPSGFIAKVIKPKKGKGNIPEAKIKIYIPDEGGEKTHVLNVAKTALETYSTNG